jgi:predicted transposase YdaD
MASPTDILRTRPGLWPGRRDPVNPQFRRRAEGASIVAKPYDSTTKFLVEGFPADWLAFAGLGPVGRVDLIDANLSTITAEADKVLRVVGDEPWLAHIEFQTSHQADLPRRLLRYNTLLDDRHNVPTRSLVVLLRPEADGPDLSGVYRRFLPGGPAFLEFRYDVVRAWLQPVEAIMAGGLGTLPMAPVSNVEEDALPEVLRRMGERFDRESNITSGLLWSATGILMGLRLPSARIKELLKGVRNMKESSFYQMILAEGRAEGEAKGEAKGKVDEARRILLRLGEKRFGPPEPSTLELIEEIAEVERIESMIEGLPGVESWEELLASLPGSE